MPHTIQIHKAQDSVPDEPVYSLTIIMDKPFPPFKDLQLCDALFESDARKLASDLIDRLPGGTLDRLFIALCEYKAGHLVVPGFPRRKR